MVPTLLALALAAPAHACGGFFCDNVQPVVQSAERILFHVHPEGGATVYVEIQYEGAAVDFGWVLPIPPGLDVQSDLDTAPAGLFDDLDRLTAPRFVSAESAADAVAARSYGCSTGCGSGVGGRDTVRSPDTSGVEVVGEAVVGPYGIEVIAAEEADNLINWLLVNGYRIPPSAEPAMQQYIDEGMEFLGLQLQPDVPEGPIDTLVFTVDLPCPMVPILLTAVAATPDMEIVTYVLADRPWVPGNYTEISVPVHAIDWIEGGGDTNYDEVLLGTLESGDPHTWVAEFRGPTAGLAAVADVSQEVLERDVYLSRYRTFLDPEDMTVDPTWTADDTAWDVSNVYAIGDVATGSVPAAAVIIGVLALVRRRRE